MFFVFLSFFAVLQSKLGEKVFSELSTHTAKLIFKLKIQKPENALDIRGW